MSTKVDYNILSGGLDLVSGAISVKPGRLSECMNFEQVFGKQGYRRIDGYERFDGNPEPSKGNYHVLAFTLGTSEIFVGDLIEGATARAIVLLVALESGTWAGGDAAGTLVLANLSSSFVASESISVSSVARATTSGLAEAGSISNPSHDYYLRLTRDYLRSEIAAVPGEGKVLGLGVYKGEVYALRNAVGGTTASLWKSSVAGWISIRTGLMPGGTLSTDVANFSGASTTLALFGCDGINRAWRYDGSAFTFIAPNFGSQATSVTSVGISVSPKTFVTAETMRSWQNGDVLLVRSSANAANRMIGTVASYDAGTKTVAINVAQVLGSGTYTDWEISKADFADVPYLVTAHKDHLFLAYPFGQLQTSDLGDPMTYTTTAALFGVGDTITGLTSMRGAVLGVFCRSKIHILSGTTTLDWQMSVNSQTSGAIFGTVQDQTGNALFLDDRGLTSLQATQKFGAFEPAIFSRDVKPLLDILTNTAVASRMCKTKFQYRMYFEGGEVLTGTILSPATELQPGDVAFTRQKYPHAPTCTGTGEMDDGSEGFFFGTVGGYVMREDVGASFDGDPIPAVMRLHFNQLKSPENKKRFRKLSLEMDSPKTVEIRFRQQFDLDNGVYKASLTNVAEAMGGGGRWETSDWDRFYWSMPSQTMAEANIDGIGKSMGLLVWHESDVDPSFILQGFLLQYSTLGMAR